MNEITYNKLNSTEAITKNLPKIIEAFVTFYGESERENIENKFKNMLVIGYCKPEKIMNIIHSDQKQKSLELIDTFFDKLNIPEEERIKAKAIYFANNELEYPNIHPINQYIGYLNGERNEYNKKQAVKFISNIYPQVTIDNIDALISSGELTEFTKIIELYNDMLKQYEEYKFQYQIYIEYVEKSKKLKDYLEKKYTKILVDEFKYLFTEEELKQIEDKLNSKYSSSIKFTNKKTECYFGSSLASSTLIDAFSQESEEILKGNSQWRKNSIINDRITYFKNNGINLGESYEIYLNNPDILKLLPELTKIAEKIIKKRNELNVIMLNEYYQSLEEYQHNVLRIEQTGLLDKKHGYNANAYEINSTFVGTNIKETDEGYIMYPILCLSIGGSPEYLDHALIHELNHVYELTLQKIEENTYYGTCGWDLVDGEIYNEQQEVTQLGERKENRNYELFSEIINELISQEITQILFDANGYIFNTPEDAKIKGGTNYEKNLFLVKEFYNTYKKEIIESRRTGDMTKLCDVIGKDNFEALNELFHIFYESFPGFSFYNTIESINKGEETEQTKIFYDIVNKRNEILSSMEMHSKKRTTSL